MEPETANSGGRYWRVEEIKRRSDIDVSIEVTLGLYEHYNCVGRSVFQYNKSEEDVRPIYILGRWGSSFEDKDADRDNRAAFEAARAVADETGTRAELYVQSQAYFESVSHESLSELIGEVGEERARELLEEERDE